MESKRSLSNKLWLFGESPFTWGAIGMLLGAIAAVVSMKSLFFVAGAVFALAVVRVKFFEGRSWPAQVTGNVVLCFIVVISLFVLWRVVPKPKEPPTADDIANAVKKKLTETVQSVGGTSAPAQEAEKPQLPLTAASKPPKRMIAKPKPKPEHPTAPGSAPPSRPASTLQAHLIITQSQKISTRPDAPVETEVVVQTDNAFPSLKFVMQCDKPLVDASPMIGGAGGMVQMMVSSGILKEHPNVFVYSYGSSTPPFGPSNPLIIDVWSKEPVKCNQVATF